MSVPIEAALAEAQARSDQIDLEIADLQSQIDVLQAEKDSLASDIAVESDYLTSYLPSRGVIVKQ